MSAEDIPSYPYPTSPPSVTPALSYSAGAPPFVPSPYVATYSAQFPYPAAAAAPPTGYGSQGTQAPLHYHSHGPSQHGMPPSASAIPMKDEEKIMGPSWMRQGTGTSTSSKAVTRPSGWMNALGDYTLPVLIIIGAGIAYWYMRKYVAPDGSSRSVHDARKELKRKPESFDTEPATYQIFAQLQKFETLDPKAYSKMFECTDALLHLEKVLKKDSKKAKLYDTSPAEKYVNISKNAFNRLERRAQNAKDMATLDDIRTTFFDMLDLHFDNILKLCDGAPIE